MIARAPQESSADGHQPPPDHSAYAAPGVRRLAACRQPVDRRARTRTPSATARASSPPRARWSSGPGKHTGRSPAGQVHRRRAVEPRQDLVGPRQPAHQRGALRPTARASRRVLRRQGPVRPGLLIGADPAHQRPLRVFTETAWASIFARNLFRRPTADELAASRPNFTIICVPSFQADPATEGTRTGTAILLHLERMEIIIVGTEYAGEIKKSAFTVMNYLMPDEGVLPMHSAGQRRARPATASCSSACPGPARRPSRPTRSGASSATTSTAGATAACSTSRAAATPRRSASRRCTSRTSSRRPAGSGRSSRTSTSTRGTRELDLDSERFTENTRGAYPLDFIGNADPTGMTGQPRDVVFLTADAFGVLPPISRLTHDQAAYHFISGYTAKLAGTEVGVKEPKATFSACFGAPFMPRHPGEYAAMLTERLERHDVAGLAGQHRLDRRSVRDRRADEHRPHPGDGPGGARRARSTTCRRGSTRPSASRSRSSCPDVPASFLDPRATWADPTPTTAAADARRDVRGELRRLARRGHGRAIRAAGPRARRARRPDGDRRRRRRRRAATVRSAGVDDDREERRVRRASALAAGDARARCRASPASSRARAGRSTATRMTRRSRRAHRIGQAPERCRQPRRTRMPRPTRASIRPNGMATMIEEDCR